ncbi:hypothetical protein AB833_16100 [Chromatiales bacterium (ex Bugula neritina AB1)]|nr:hypothetical protein AB833_16100 [Chromatiales bacterium (ex Bugula neritina AB1)]
MPQAADIPPMQAFKPIAMSATVFFTAARKPDNNSSFSTCTFPHPLDEKAEFIVKEKSER